MKYKIFLLLFTLLAFANSIVAQNTGLFTYTGGYFIKDGNNWYEYRPGDKVGVWASYTQYGEEENFYNIENNINYVSVPKDPSNSFFVAKENGEWKPIYTTRNFYNFFTDEGRDLYCYNGGYFVRNGTKWKEYRPGDKQSAWSTYSLYKSDDDFFYIESSADKVAIPKSKDVSGSIFLYKNNDWEAIYTVSDIYESKGNGYYASAGSSPGNNSNLGNNSSQQSYDYTLRFSCYEIWDDKEGSYGDDIYAPCSVSISRKGYGLISYGSKKVEFRFTRIIEYEHINNKGPGANIIEALLFIAFSKEKGFALYENIDDETEIISYVDTDIENVDSTEGGYAVLYIDGLKGVPSLKFSKCSSRKIGKEIHDITENHNFFKKD